MKYKVHPKYLPAIITISLVLAALFSSTYLGVIVQKVGFIEFFDKYFYNIFANGYHSAILDTAVYPVSNNFLPSFFGQTPSFLYVIALIFFVVVWIRHRERVYIAISTYLVALSVAVGSLWLSTYYVNRQRPFLSLVNSVPQNWQNIWAHFASWPSGHVRDTAVLATIIAYYLPRTRWYMVALVVFVAWSRLYLGAHYPTDVVGGALVGFLIGTLAIYIVEFVKRKLDEKNK